MKGNPRAKVDAERVNRVPDETRPLLLLVSENEPELMTVRAQLREAGYLVASSRSIAAAVSLLDQVRVDGCVLLGRASALEAAHLALSLERYTPRSPKISLVAPDFRAPEGWKGCPREQLITVLNRAFAIR